MEVARTFADARVEDGGIVGLVPTMGFLHEGHLSLLRLARRECHTVVMSHYVNPLQFDEESDLHRYPRDFERDVELAGEAGADIVFAPPGGSMFATELATRVSLRALSETMEGSIRPGHFTGVATVVAKLIAGLQPDRAYFGRKDAQQLAVVRRMARDLSFPVEIVGCPIVREHDGLALSSRNVFLGAGERRAALALSLGLTAAAELALDGERTAAVLEGVAMRAMSGTEGVDPEYAQLASQADVTAVDMLDGPAFLAVAARLGRVRLIDNVHFDAKPGGMEPDMGTRLENASILYESI